MFVSKMSKQKIKRHAKIAVMSDGVLAGEMDSTERLADQGRHYGERRKLPWELQK